MPAFKSLAASLAAVAPVMASSRLLAPAQDIQIDTPSESATNPLQWLGANSPWFAGPNVNGIDPEVPANCYVEQAAYAVRHGSRYPDTGAYNGWVAMQQRVSGRDRILTQFSFPAVFSSMSLYSRS
jgi:hypothetical protein